MLIQQFTFENLTCQHLTFRIEYLKQICYTLNIEKHPKIPHMKSITSNSTVFNLLPNESILEGLERTGHEVDYQCRSGYCGMCRVKKLEGTVEYLEEPLAFVSPEEILPCVCVASSNLKLDTA